MRSLFFAASLDGERIALNNSESHHGERVMRIREGEEVRVGDGQGQWVEGPVISLSPLQIRADRRGADSQSGITVLQALIKGDAGTDAVSLMTEVGIDAIIPWNAEHSVARWQGDKISKGIQKWSVAAQEAAKQSRRSRIPEIHDLCSTSEVKALLPKFDHILVLHESALTPLESTVTGVQSNLLLVVGPEGGISTKELELFAPPAQIVNLGPYVLRSMHAGSIAAAIILAQQRNER